MSDPSRQHESPPAAPPTVAAPLASPERRSGWPGVIGTIAIVFGALAAIGGVWSFVSLVFLPKIMELMTPGAESSLSQTEPMRRSILFQGTTAVSLGALLIFAGIAMLRRRRRCVRLSAIWALLKMPVVVIGTVLGVSVQQANFDAMAQSPGGPPMGFLSAFLWVGVAFGVLWGWALPVFMLVWLSRRTIRKETAEWS